MELIRSKINGKNVNGEMSTLVGVDNIQIVALDVDFKVGGLQYEDLKSLEGLDVEYSIGSAAEKMNLEKVTLEKEDSDYKIIIDLTEITDNRQPTTDNCKKC